MATNYLDKTGLGTLWGKIKSTINSARTMAVHITWDSTNSKYVSDKTFAEIYNAFNNDTNIIAILDDLTVCDLITCYYDSEYGYGAANFCSATIYGVDDEVCVDGLCIDIQAENANLEETITIDLRSGNSFIPVGSTSVDVPLMDGTANHGYSLKFARADHIHPSDTTKANVSDVLTKTNTTAYTPTATYHPATKGYVDGLIPANVSDLNNDAGYQTQSQVNALIAAAGDDDTTYAISMSGNVITLTGSDGNTSTVTLPVYTGGVT